MTLREDWFCHPSLVVFLQRWVEEFLQSSMLFSSSCPLLSICLALEDWPVLISQHHLNSRLQFQGEPGLPSGAHECPSETAGDPWQGSAQQFQELENRSLCKFTYDLSHLPLPLPCTYTFHHHLIFKPSRDFYKGVYLSHDSFFGQKISVIPQILMQ